MLIIINIVLLIALIIGGYQFFGRNSELRIFFWPAIILKLIAGLFIGLLYSSIYSGGDTWEFYDEALKLRAAGFDSLDSFVNIYFNNDYSNIGEYSYVIQPRAAFMTKILAPMLILTGNNYWLISCYLSLFSFTGFWLISNSFYELHKNKWAAAVPFLFIPSVVLWTSGVLKESIAIGAMAGVMAIVLKVYLSKKITFYNALLVGMGILLLLQLKYYLGAILIVTIVSLFLSRWLIPLMNKLLPEYISVTIVFFLTLLVASLTHPNFYPSRFFTVIVENYNQYLVATSNDNVVVFTNFSPSILSFISNAPKALFAGLFMPLWYADLTLFRLLAVVENWVLLILLIFTIKFWSFPSSRDVRLLTYAIILFIITSAVLITFSTPNFGTLVRYKVGYYPIFIALITGILATKIPVSNRR